MEMKSLKKNVIDEFSSYLFSHIIIFKNDKHNNKNDIYSNSIVEFSLSSIAKMKVASSLIFIHMNDEGHNYYDKQQHGAEKYEEECN